MRSADSSCLSSCVDLHWITYSGLIQYSQGTGHEEERPKESDGKDEGSGVRESKRSTATGTTCDRPGKAFFFVDLFPRVLQLPLKAKGLLRAVEDMLLNAAANSGQDVRALLQANALSVL